jgi:Family of unknown function (DUF5939)
MDEQALENATGRPLQRPRSAKRRLDEERVISTFLHAAQLGLFELSWNVLCPLRCTRPFSSSTRIASRIVERLTPAERSAELVISFIHDTTG